VAAKQSIRVLGGAHTALALGDTQIALPGPGSRFARLSDIATVHDGVGEIRSMARLNGRDATTFGVAKAKGASRCQRCWPRFERELEKVSKENPQVTMTKVFTTVDYTKQAIPLGAQRLSSRDPFLP